MNAKRAWMLTACLVLPICIGCGAGANVIRGQNPVDHIPTEVPADSGVQQAAFEAGPNADLSRRIVPVNYANSACTDCVTGGCNTCPSGACPTCQYGTCRHGAYGSGFGHGLFDGLHGHHGHGCRCKACLGDWGCNGYGWYPRHYHTYEYEQPRHLSFPSNDQPAGVVQYPYYTVKGPSDFFME